MPTAQKERSIEQAREWYSKAAGVVFTDYRGLKVKDMQQLRAQLSAKGGELHVVKNTLFRRAAGSDMAALPPEFHNGPTAIAFVYQNETDCAKVLFDYSHAHKSFVVKGGFLGGKLFDAKTLEALSKLPPRDVLIAQVIGAIASPLTSLVGVIDALVAQPVRTIYAVADKLGATPAPSATDLDVSKTILDASKTIPDASATDLDASKTIPDASATDADGEAESPAEPEAAASDTSDSSTESTGADEPAPDPAPES